MDVVLSDHGGKTIANGMRGFQLCMAWKSPVVDTRI